MKPADRTRIAAPVTLTLVAAISALMAPTAGAGSCNTWTVMESPNPAGSRAQFIGLKVIAPDDVWAVGEQRPIGGGGDPSSPLAAHFDGTDWTIVPVPNPAWSFDRLAELYDVDGLSSDDVWAVGQFMHPDEADIESFVVHWDGIAWSWIPSPTQPNGEGAVFGQVEVVGVDDVWAVGSWPGPSPGAIIEPLAAHWDGNEWTIFPVPVVADDSRFSTIEALAPDDIWGTVNLEFVTAGPIEPIIVHFDGSSWSLVSPAPAAEYTGVGDIAAIGPNDVWVTAARWNSDDIFNPTPAFLHWDGSGWTEFATPGGGRFIVNGPDDIRSVGLNMITQWDGVQWSVIAQDDIFPDDPYAFLNDVAQVDGCTLLGAGKTGVADDVRTMLVRTGPIACVSDVDGNATVGIADMLALLAAWGPNPGHPADIDGDGAVGITDFLVLLADWGPCP